MSQIYSKFAGDEDWNELLVEFVGAIPLRVDAINKALAANDHPRLLMLIHQLKGACGSYGFDELTALAEQLEQSILQRSEETEHTDWVGKPVPRMEEFLDALKRMTCKANATIA